MKKIVTSLYKKESILFKKSYLGLDVVTLFFY